MANIQQITRDYLLRAKTEGVPATIAATQQLGSATDALATKTETVTKSQVSAAAALDRLQRQLDTSYRSAKQFEQAQRDLDRAQQQGLLSISSHAALLAKATQQYGQASAASKAFQTVTSGVSGQLIALSAGAGPVGTFLSALGPWGLAAAVGIGAVSAALNHMVAEAERIGDKANEIRKFGVITGLTVEQIKALTKAGGSLGVDSGDVTSAIEKLTIGLEEARKGAGTLFDQVRVLNPELAIELARSASTAQGIDAYAKALKAATSETQRAALARAGLGKGGQETGLVLISVADLGGLDAAAQKTKAVTGLTGDWVKEVAHLRNENIQLEKETANLMANMYARDVLQRQNEFLKVQRDIAVEIARTGKNPNAAAAVGGGFGFGAELDLSPPSTKAQIEPSKELQTATKELDDIFKTFIGTLGLYTDGADRAAKRAKELTDAHDRELKGLQLLTNTERDRLSALGSAATIDEKRLQRINEITVALGKHEFATVKSTAADEEVSAKRAVAAANLDAQIQKTGALNGILGAAATVQQQYIARVQQINKAQAEGAGATPAQIENAYRLAKAQADGTFALKGQIDALNVQAKTASMTTAQAETYSLIQTKTNEAINAGVPVSAMLTESYRKLAEQMGQAKQDSELAVALDQAQFDAKTAMLTPLEKEIALLQKKNGINPQTDEIASIKRTTDATEEARKSAISFGQDFAHSMMAGKSFTDSLSSSLKNLSARLTDKAIEQLLSGEWQKAAVSAASALVTWVASTFTGNKGEEHANVIKSIDYVSQLQQRQIAATQDMASLAGQLTAFDKAANIERMMNDRDGGRERNQLELTLSEERAKIINDFNATAVANDQAAAAARIAAQDAINKRMQGFQDRLLAATTDQTTLQGQLTILDRTQQREREAEVATGGQALVDLEAAQAAERFGVIKKFNDAIVASAQQTAQQQLDAQTKAARSIVDYLSNLNTGSASTLSPQARLAAAQSAYNVKLALAQGGNTDALGGITQDAENLRKAAQDFYASGAGYQAIFQQIKSQLLSLPAVATSTDPVVAAMRDNIVATQAVTVAVQNDTTQVVNQFNTAIQKFADAVTYMSQAVNQLVTSNALLDAIRTLNNTSQQQLVLLTNNLTGSSTNYGMINGFQANMNRNLLETMRTIAINTYATSVNTARSVDFQRNGQGSPPVIGVLAGGGWIQGGIPNKDSVLLGARTAIGMPGEFVVSKDVAQANASWLPQFNETGRLPFANDNLARPSFGGGAAGSNGDMVAVLRSLLTEVASLKQELRFNTAVANEGNNVNRAGHAATSGAIDKQRDAASAEERQARINPKAA